MIVNFRKWFDERVNTVDDRLSEWYWRRKYNDLLGRFELLKEVMRDDVYNKTIKTIAKPLEIAGYKKTIKRLSNILTTLREERNNLIVENREFKRYIKEQDALKVGQVSESNKK